jgi:hypothetical protein
MDQLEPQQLPGTHPLDDGELPQQEPPVMGPGGDWGMENAAADICFSTLEPPHERQANVSEFLPIPTSSSLT